MTAQNHDLRFGMILRWFILFSARFRAPIERAALVAKFGYKRISIILQNRTLPFADWMHRCSRPAGIILPNGKRSIAWNIARDCLTTDI